MEVVDAQSRPDGDTKNRILSPFSYVLILLGVCAHLVGFFVFRVVSNPLPTREAIPPFVQFVSPSTLVSGAVLEEQAALFDSAPLFVPGKWNASHNLRPLSRERTLLSFSAYGEPQSDFSTALITEGLPVGLESAVTEPADLLALRYWDLFRGVGQTASFVEELEDTGVFVEVRTIEGRVVQTVSAELAVLSMQAIQPTTYFQRVEAGGRVLGRPTLSVSSGDSTFDTAAYTWLVESGFSAGLPAGFFEIRVYP
ncbi:MAG: hypothetical protein DBX01_03455 [Puniceicoccaceae bacterium]|nr:hypothetical protein [Puniceicoccaceae bacterium]RCL34751.1 MAG: hypothetical protein DBX01_03455 [Puniceicoccaceae bacterium]|tara:strand:+ start:5014 stop:5775 length:762 start_codon:yes stop_codon:yes gene_type:complete